MMKPYFETEFGKLYHGDCLEVTGGLHSVDAIITDPPFAFTGGISNGSSANVSGQFFSHWWRAVCERINQVMHKGASGFIWCDWKTAKLISEGFEPTQQTYDHFRVAQMLYHYRQMPGMGRPFRSSVDMIAYIRGPKHKDPDIPATTLNHIDDYWYYGKHDYHPSEKSPAVVEMLMRWCSTENQTIVDFFFGSGVVGIVAEKLNRKWIGIESIEEYCEISAKRIENETRQLKLF